MVKLFPIFVALFSITASAAQVLTQHNDSFRTGANMEEEILSPSNVYGAGFGKLFTHNVDGQVYGQPLVVAVNSAGKHRNLVIVATEHNSVYAFDADDSGQKNPIWKINLGTSALVKDTPFSDDHTLMPEIGITSTPVIDLVSRVVFVEVFSHDSDGYHHRVHALDLATGADQHWIEIGGSYGGDTFDPLWHRQRPALLLVSTPSGERSLHVAFGSQDDHGTYHGWMFAYDADSLQPLGIFSTSSYGDTMASIWMAGQGPAADENGNIYFITANGEGVPSSHNLAEAFVKLNLTPGGYSLLDWFVPFDYQNLNAGDLDLSSSGAVLIPGTSLLIGGGKTGKLYVLDREHMGNVQEGSDSQILESFQATQGPIFNSPVYWNNHIYIWGVGDQLRSYQVMNGKIDQTPASMSSEDMSSIYPGGILSISANGVNKDTGILWVTRAIAGDGHGGFQSGMLQAFNASDVSQELWSSEDEMNDRLGTLAKFCPPTIANGKVYVATFDNRLIVYGLKH